jgi:hypothetical protein
MAADNSSARPSAPVPPRHGSSGKAPANRRRRLIFRLLLLPILAGAAFLLFKYSGLRDYLELPQCDSDHAKEWLGQALQPFKFNSTGYESIKTISISKQEVVCRAMLTLPNGSSIAIDYSFYWNGNKVNMRYSVPLTGSGSPPPPLPPAVPVR